MVNIKLGPAGLGPVSEAFSNLEEIYNKGLQACETEFVRQIYIKKEDAIEIGKKAKELGIVLSIHAPYYVNLNSKEIEKVNASKERILKCCEIGQYLGAKQVVFHPGYYGDLSKEETFKNIKERITEMMEVIKKNKWDVEICPETMGKVNVFGSIEDISNLAKETGCSFCIDFAHILARYKENKFDEIEKFFPQKRWHCHFSGIEYGEKGEKKHLVTSEENWKGLFNFLKNLDKEIVIINESPRSLEDSVNGLKILNKMD
ncbi:MAG: TIM barrel protein [Candidatus Pacearchaeota archaeon]